MTDHTDIALTDAVELAESRTGLTLNDGLTTTEASWDHFRDALRWQVQQILDHRIAELPQLLYRVDVAEAKVDAAFARASADDLATALADLIIERLIEKLRTRKKYEGLL